MRFISRREYSSPFIAFVLLGALSFAPGASSSSHAAQQRAASSAELKGNWEGSIDVGGSKLRLVFKISKEADGSLNAKLDSPDQGVADLPVAGVTQDGQIVRLDVKIVGGGFEGTLNQEGLEIVGQWKQGGASLPLTLRRSDRAPLPVRRPQEPQKPYPYNEEEVVYENRAAAGVKLAGTLTLPRTKGPFPAVLLITGSGPQDRNEALLGHKPFLVLADYLTRQGIAVLRFDDRGTAKSSGNFATATSEDFAGDALAGIDYLKTRKEINPQQIGLIGHSEGGLIAPMVAAKSADVAFIVLMAGPGVTGEEILYLQGALISKAMGATEEAIAKSRANQEQMFRVLKEEKDQAAAEKRLREIAAASLQHMTEEQKKAAGGSPEAAMEAQLKQVNTPWFRYFLTYDPRTSLTKVKSPVLAINGELDLQVPPKQNLPEITKALQAAGNRDVRIVELPKLNHLFQTCQTGSPAEYAKIEETIAPLALQTIGDWILAQTTKR